MRRLVLVFGILISALLFWRFDLRWAVACFFASIFIYSLLSGGWRSVTRWLLFGTFVLSIAVGGWLASAGGESIELFALGGAIGAIIYIVAAMLTFFICSELYIVMRGGGRDNAWRCMLGFVATSMPIPSWLPLPFAQMFRCVQVVDGGSVVFSFPRSDTFKMMGPGIIIVNNGNAVILENTGRLTRIHGPGFLLTDRWEFISAILDLRLQKGVYEPKEEILTKDGIPLKIRFTVLYRLMGDEAVLIAEGRYHINEEAIRRAALGATDWCEQTEIVARATLRDTIAGYYLDEIYDPRGIRFRGTDSPRGPLQATLRDRLNLESERWGVEIVRVTLDEIHMPDQVKHRMLEAWDVNWGQLVELAKAMTETRSLLTRAWGHALALSEVEDVKTTTRISLIRTILSDIEDKKALLSDPAVNRYMAAIARLSESMLVDETLARRYLEVIEQVAQSEAAKVVLPGPSSNFILDAGQKS
jgi:regulator of protease activity HflC (stomatin/prohibitin superfamily)